MDVHPDISLVLSEGEIRVERPSDNRRHRALHGTMRSLVQNMVTGVSAGFQKDLEIQGIGYRANLQGSTLTLSLGFSHPINYAAPSDVQLEVKDQRVIAVKGIDRQRVGQVAAIIRGFKPPEPYKGTGIRYAGERIRRKEGKAGAK
jgi:large subunit ribosomal protein L6